MVRLCTTRSWSSRASSLVLRALACGTLLSERGGASTRASQACTSKLERALIGLLENARFLLLPQRPNKVAGIRYPQLISTVLGASSYKWGNSAGQAGDRWTESPIGKRRRSHPSRPARWFACCLQHGMKAVARLSICATCKGVTDDHIVRQGRRSTQGQVPHRDVGSSLEEVDHSREARYRNGVRHPPASQQLPCGPRAARPGAPVESAAWSKHEYINPSGSCRRHPGSGGQGATEGFPSAPANSVPELVPDRVVGSSGEDIDPVGAP